MPRPRGEIREALANAAQSLAAELGMASSLEIVRRAQVGSQIGQFTVKNMVKAGELEPRDSRREPGIARPVTLYAPARASSWVTGFSSLDDILRSWSRR
jgi:hypothetical protein